MLAYLYELEQGPLDSVTGVIMQAMDCKLQSAESCRHQGHKPTNYVREKVELYYVQVTGHDEVKGK